ncbi:MAG TPA: hypothetical protein VHO95_05035 [Candidatus Dormibacteraeota bacterium]|jgi:hypothetical protein|nr:hypothetical protein [Candidatus Dormibacteraeota bacterium]
MSTIASRLQKVLGVEIGILLLNLFGVFEMVGATYGMATEDGFTGVTLYFGYLTDGAILAALVAIEILTAVVTVRTWRMLDAANKGNVGALKNLSSAGWATIAIFSSYVATGLMLLKVNTMVHALDAKAA